MTSNARDIQANKIMTQRAANESQNLFIAQKEQRTMLDSCGANCGWTAAIVSCLCFGTFAVPIKSRQAEKVDVDPLVFHTYKVIMCFITSWIVLPLGQDFYFTPWAFVSNLFWVPASMAAVFAVKNAGLAMTHGVCCTGIVLVSFVWGIFIFNEKIKSKVNASLAILLVVIGIWGMSVYSSPEFEQSNLDNENDKMTPSKASTVTLSSESSSILNYKDASYGGMDNADTDYAITDYETIGVPLESTSFLLPRKRKLSNRTLGLLAAVFNGLWGGR